MSRRGKIKHRSRFYILFTLALLVGFLGYREWDKHSSLRSNNSIDLGELPDGYLSFGIDISHHQGRVNWKTFFNSNDSIVKFVYCKATEGVSHVDTQWKRNRRKLLKQGIPNGAYHFFLPNKNATRQAEHFLSQCDLNDSDLPPVLDAEVEASTNTQLIDGMKKWLEIVEQRTGRRPIIYTSYHFYKTKFKPFFPKHKFWIANYNNKSSRLEDESIIHWQYSDKGTIPGIDTYVDLNVSKLPF